MTDDGVWSTPSSDPVRRRAADARRASRLRGAGGRARVPLSVCQRSPALRGGRGSTGRPHSPRCSAKSGDDDDRHDRRAPGDPRARANREAARRARRPVGRPPRRRRRAGIVAARLRRRRRSVRGAVAALRRGAPRPPLAARRERGRLRGHVLLHGGRRPRAALAAAGRPPAVDRELGLDRRAATGRPARRRLAGLRVQHDTVELPRAPRRRWRSDSGRRARARRRSRTGSPPCGST